MPNNPNPANLTGLGGNPALQWLIQNDPYLASNLSLAMSQGNLTGFNTNNAAGTGAIYGVNPGIISIDPGTLAAANNLFNNGVYAGVSAANLTTLLTLDFQLNHETWHADVNTYVTDYGDTV